MSRPPFDLPREVIVVIVFAVAFTVCATGSLAWHFRRQMRIKRGLENDRSGSSTRRRITSRRRK
ncbi:hypothetical protein CBM2598_U20098 [Cupriavidus taiwanensis]|nr:hypothetical protein CBM2598_U20098 [Cupriavidus taiwanensis]